MPKMGAPTAHQWNVQCLTIQGVEERCKLIPRKLAVSLKVIKASIGLLLLKALQKPAGPSRTFSTLGNIPQPETMHTCSPEGHCVLWPLIFAHLLDKEEPCLVLNPVVSLSLCSLPAHAHQATTKTYSNDSDLQAAELARSLSYCPQVAPRERTSCHKRNIQTLRMQALSPTLGDSWNQSFLTESQGTF